MPYILNMVGLIIFINVIISIRVFIITILPVSDKPNKGKKRKPMMCEKCMSHHVCDCLCEFDPVKMNNYEYTVNRCPFCSHIERGSIRDYT